VVVVVVVVVVVCSVWNGTVVSSGRWNLARAASASKRAGLPVYPHARSTQVAQKDSRGYAEKEEGREGAS
jgi:hypothetical protein